MVPCDTGGAIGLNSRGGLAGGDRVMRERINAEHLANGVTLVDPDSTFIDVEVRIGRDTTIAPERLPRATPSIGRGLRDRAVHRIADSSIGDRQHGPVLGVQGSTIGRDVEVGPFARMRPGVVLEDGSKAGAFVELKDARVGRGAKGRTCRTSATPRSARTSTSGPARSRSTTTGTTNIGR